MLLAGMRPPREKRQGCLSLCQSTLRLTTRLMAGLGKLRNATSRAEKGVIQRCLATLEKSNTCLPSSWWKMAFKQNGHS